MAKPFCVQTAGDKDSETRPGEMPGESQPIQLQGKRLADNSVKGMAYGEIPAETRRMQPGVWQKWLG